MPEPSPAARSVIAHARDVITDVLDEVHGTLLDASTGLDAAAKDDGTLVTDTDVEVDERLGARLEATFPDHGVLSEERHTRSPDTDWTWVIDPIDGTSNYTCGLPYWCVSVALTLEGAAVLAVIDAPVIGRRYLAEVGRGTVLETRRSSREGDRAPHRRPLHVRPTTDWRAGRNHHVPLMLTTGTARRARAAGIMLKPRVMGSTALDMAAVAEGAAAASVAVVPKVWDVAAGHLLVEEAGGVVLTPDGSPLLPMPRDVEHRDRSAVTLAGPDEGYLRTLAAALEIG